MAYYETKCGHKIKKITTCWVRKAVYCKFVKGFCLSKGNSCISFLVHTLKSYDISLPLAAIGDTL